MACTDEFVAHVAAVAAQVGTVRSRKMFGDWMIYVDEKAAIIASDNQAYVKMLPEMAEAMVDAETGYPYEGAKLHYILDVDHQEQAVQILRELLPLLSFPKKKNRK